MTRSPSVELLGEQAPPRVRVVPASTRANSWEDVADLSSSFGLVLDPWQEAVLQASMGERADGRWAAHQVGLSAPRQNGKSQLIVARALAGALLFDEQLIVVSAHQQDTARETFAKFVELIESSPALEARIAPRGVMNALNREQIKFTNGATIKFKARSTAGGRGFSSDCLFLDEAQILGQRAWASIRSTMSARTNPQVWLMGTPPTPEDDGEVFTKIRGTALAGKASSLAYLEWSAEPDDDPASDEARAKANPAWWTRINHDIVQGEFESYTPQQFAQERLGIWLASSARSVIDWDAWAALQVDPQAAPTDGAVCVGVKFSADGQRVGAAVALRPAEGPTHAVALGVHAATAGASQLVSWIAQRWQCAAEVLVDGKAGAGDLVSELVAAGVPARRVRVVPTDEAVTAHAGMLRAIEDGAFTHAGQPGLDAAVRVAGRRKIGNLGGWGWQSITPEGDVTALDAVTLARHGAASSKRKTNRRSGASNGRRAVVM